MRSDDVELSSDETRDSEAGNDSPTFPSLSLSFTAESQATESQMSAIVARSTPPTPLPQEPATKEDKHVSFHPLAVYITTAPEGEPEQTMVDHAREELSHRRRRVGVRTYRCDPGS